MLSLSSPKDTRAVGLGLAYAAGLLRPAEPIGDANRKWLVKAQTVQAASLIFEQKFGRAPVIVTQAGAGRYLCGYITRVEFVRAQAQPPETKSLTCGNK